MRWIDGNENCDVGTIGFLREATKSGGSSHLRLSPSPCHTNRSGEPRLFGWCGETDNVSQSGLGLARVVRVAANGRVQIVPVSGAEGATWLTDVAGYPDLVPDEWDAP